MRQFIETLFAVAALVGAEAWFLQGYGSGKPEFEPTIAFIAALGLLLLKDPIRIAWRKPAAEHDAALYRRFLQEFPSNGRAATFLDSHDIGAPFHSRELEELDRFSETWIGAEHEFISKALESQRVKLLQLLRKFRNELSLNVFAARSEGFLTMDLRDYEDRPEAWAKRDSLNALSSEVFKEHQELVRLGRRVLQSDA